MKRLFSILIVIFVTLTSYSQRTAKVSSTYTYYAPETMSVEEAKRIALERAQIQAISDEFGTVVSQSTSTMMTNQNGKTDSHFFATGGSDVKGEWIETIGEPKYDLKFEDHFLVVSCSIKGKVREIINTDIHIKNFLLKNGVSLKNEASEFKDGDDMYLWFQSPCSGYLVVFWLDYNEKRAYRILPYQSESITLTQIIKDKTYVFFSKDTVDLNYASIVDEFSIICDTDNEYNEVYIIFSEEKFNLNNIDGFTEGIKWIDIDNFKQWIAWLRKQRSHITIKHHNIQIKRT